MQVLVVMSGLVLVLVVVVVVVFVFVFVFVLVVVSGAPEHAVVFVRRPLMRETPPNPEASRAFGGVFATRRRLPNRLARTTPASRGSVQAARCAATWARTTGSSQPRANPRMRRSMSRCSTSTPIRSAIGASHFGRHVKL